MNHYIVEESLGHGNYGQIYRVRHVENQIQYVCKKIELASKTAVQRKEAENEVANLSKLHHPNIVGFFEAFIESDILHIIMENCDGPDLEKVLLHHNKHKTTMSESKILHVVAQIALGLRYLHERHLLHRDLKSANVFLTSSGAVKLGDFGFSKQLNYTMALANTVCGTPYYFAPELCQRLPYNNKADVWGLGVILYEMINLRKPFEAKNLKELRIRVVGEKPAPFTTNVSNDLKDLCMLMLRKNSAARPSVDQVLQLPILKTEIEKLCARMKAMETAATTRAEEIQSKFKRAEGESPQERSLSSEPAKVLQSGAGFDHVRADPAAWRAMMKNPEAATAVPSPPKVPKQEIISLYSRVPNARDTLSKQAPTSAVAEYHKNLTEKEDAYLLKTETTKLLDPTRERRPSLNVPPEDATDTAAALAMGEAQDELERRLREVLGDAKFMKAVELFFFVAETTSEPEKEKRKTALLNLLGDKQYLLPDIEKTSLSFELA